MFQLAWRRRSGKGRDARVAKRKNKKRLPRSSARDRLEAQPARCRTARSSARLHLPTLAVASDARRGIWVTRARVRLLNGRARRRFGRARCASAQLCPLSQINGRRVVPVRGDSALARERVAGGEAARRLGERRDPASQGRPRRHRDGREGSNRDRSAAGNEGAPWRAGKISLQGARFEVACWSVDGLEFETGDWRRRRAPRPARFSDAKSDRAAGRARQKTILRALDTATRFARVRVHRSPWRRASRHSRKVRRESRRSPLSANGRLPPRPRLPRLVRAPSPSRLPRDTA